MIRYYLSPIIGSGTIQDPFRPKIADLGIPWVGVIATQPNGTPQKSWCIVLVDTADPAVLDSDVDLGGFPSADANALISDFAQNVRNRLQNELDKRGIAVTVSNFVTVGELITAIAQTQEPTFTLGAFAVGSS